ncbi:hypothetical protein JYK00_02135 [Thermosipho ferrireducens]|uniref:Uncharacterized protein n=1 Tax=Thermosipho ferrireducens TaxID=2571116 RepID=A0ABX7S817_9BACT|nr:DUF6115 domain-containing protein [Thermosipho ferrireducens]QTA38354.1 hypothetical protein JYK00_02135 [Thermosipho ferrireducens]
MGVLEWLVLFGTIGALSFSWGIYILESFYKKSGSQELKKEEERLLDLMGKVRIFVDSKIELLDAKLEEVNKVTEKLNDMYSKLMLQSVEIEKLKEEINFKNRQFGDISQEPQKDTQAVKADLTNEFERKASEKPASETKKEKSIEEQIIEMFYNGVSEVDIAKKFNMGIGEVRLIIDLMSRSKG